MVLRTIRLRSVSAAHPTQLDAGMRQTQIKSVSIFQPAQKPAEKPQATLVVRSNKQKKRQPVCPKRRKTGVHRRFEQTITIPSVESDANVAPSVGMSRQSQKLLHKNTKVKMSFAWERLRITHADDILSLERDAIRAE